MTDDEMFEALEAATAGIVAVPPAAYGAPVASCPGWSVADLVEHTGGVHRWAALNVRSRSLQRSTRDRTSLPEGADVHAYYVESVASLLQALRAADLDEPVWTFLGPRPTRWWLRRQLHETAVHRWDAEAAAGTATPIPAQVAADTVDEILHEFIGAAFDHEAFGSAGQTIHLHATDAPGEWSLRLDPGYVTVTHDHVKGEAAARATASDLALFAWSRVPAAQLETFGDIALLDRFQAAASV